MNYKQLAKDILEIVGGSENVVSCVNCATRLRFKLVDESKFDEDAIQKLDGVIGTKIAGGQCQVIIGPNVAHVCDALNELLDPNSVNTEEVENSGSKLSIVLDTISGIFTPILPAITGAAMIKVILILLTMFHIMDAESQTYAIFSFVADTPFYFLPIMISYSAAQKFKLNPMIGMVLSLMLINPTYVEMVSAGDKVSMFGFLPVTLTTYTSTVIPLILIIWVASYIDRFADKISPEAVKFFLRPLITILVMTPIAFCLVGPLGQIVGMGLGSILDVVQTQAPWVLPIVFGVLAPIFIMFGMHYAVTIPLVMTAIQVNGFDMIGAGFLVANMGQAGAAFAIARLAKDKDFKAMAGSSGLTALLGVTEPALYGVNLKLKKPFLYALIGGGLGGIVCGIFGVKRIVFGPTGLTTLPIFIDPDNSMNIVWAVVGVIVSFIVAYALTYYKCKNNEDILKEIR